MIYQYTPAFIEVIFPVSLIDLFLIFIQKSSIAIFNPFLIDFSFENISFFGDNSTFDKLVRSRWRVWLILGFGSLQNWAFRGLLN
jgi:ABC-type polysaccharide transport system permease subunit